MTKRICRRCGSALTEGANFCTSCGANAPISETTAVYAPETRPLSRAETDPKKFATPSHDDDGKEIRQTAKAPSGYDTEELPQATFAPPVESDVATFEAQAPVKQPHA